MEYFKELAHYGTDYADQEKARDGPEDDVDADLLAGYHAVYDHHGGIEDERQIDEDQGPGIESNDNIWGEENEKS